MMPIIRPCSFEHLALVIYPRVRVYIQRTTVICIAQAAWFVNEPYLFHACCTQHFLALCSSFRSRFLYSSFLLFPLSRRPRSHLTLDGKRGERHFVIPSPRSLRAALPISLSFSLSLSRGTHLLLRNSARPLSRRLFSVGAAVLACSAAPPRLIAERGRVNDRRAAHQSQSISILAYCAARNSALFSVALRGTSFLSHSVSLNFVDIRCLNV